MSIASIFYITYTGNDLSSIKIIGITAAVAISIFVILSVMRVPFLEESNILRLCGKYSLEIYVFHNYITAANRMILIKLGITEFYTNIAANFLMAVIIPICMGVVLKKSGLYQYLFKPGHLYKK